MKTAFSFFFILFFRDSPGLKNHKKKGRIIKLKIRNFFRALFPVLFASSVGAMTAAETFALHTRFGRGRYAYYGRSNGSSRRRRTNRLRLSKKTRNKHR
jgi:hypothetical protein